MTDDNAVVLTARDFTLLENLVHNWGDPFPGANEQIRRKLAAATVVFPDDLTPGAAAPGFGRPACRRRHAAVLLSDLCRASRHGR